jgi:hypothetical protein
MMAEAELRGRALMESRYGPIGTGKRSLSIGGVEYSIDELLFRMGLNFEDAKPIDLVTVSPGLYVVRYYDGQDQRVVAHEFDAEFKFLREVRGHVAEWIGEESYYSLFSGH